MKKDSGVYLKHMHDACQRIENFTKGYQKEMFLQSELVQSAVTRQIEILGEAAKNISTEFRKNYPLIEWSDIAGMRDKVIHHYFGVDLNEVWNVVIKEVPRLKKEIIAILHQIEPI